MNRKPDHTLEICAADIQSVSAAYRGGADRVELCSGLLDGGLTPSISFIESALRIPDIRVNVLIRPRGGHFVYDSLETDIMRRDINKAIEAGVHGIVIGALCHDGSIDSHTCRKILEDVPHGFSITFHRAFDLCARPLEALEQIIDLGCNRILTSGCATTAEQGIDVLHQLVVASHGRISIMAGSGVNVSNALTLMQAGVDDLHASARSAIPSPMTFRQTGVGMGAKDADEYTFFTTNHETVRRLADIVHRHNETF